MTGRAAILGLGRRGTRWAEACQKAGWEVVGFDPDDRAGRTLAGDKTWHREQTISGTVKGVDWVICCLPERLELMRTVVRRAQAAAPEGAMIAVASRTFDIDAIQGCSIRPSRVFRVTEDDDGALTLDLNAQNPEDMRNLVKETFSGLAAVLSLSPASGSEVAPLGQSKEA
ncbi:MAG: hypothetical protein HKN18_17320 [Silicimonas sp.]|nr:hypothetical protein [Silicimonas sp.]